MNAPPPERMIEKFVMYNYNKDQINGCICKT